MSETRDKQRSLPRSLRADTVIKTPLSCRFGWHHIHWQEADRFEQRGACTRCGRVKKKVLW